MQLAKQCALAIGAASGIGLTLARPSTAEGPAVAIPVLSGLKSLKTGSRTNRVYLNMYLEDNISNLILRTLPCA